MTAAYPHLFTPGKLGSLEMRNRAIVAPMTRASATADGLVTEQMVEYYAEFARGGWGMVETEAAYIDLAYSQGYLFQPGIANEAQQESWRPVVEAAHREGTPIFMQIFHGGAINQGNNWVEGSISASPIQPRGQQIDRYRGHGKFQTPREITREEIARAVADFAAAAKRAAEVGFDGIELHGANGYLPDQFLSDHTNQRSDEYNGPIENRVRFHCEVMEAIRAAVPDKPVGVRISQTKVNDFDYVWPGGEADAKVVFSRLAQTGADFIHVSAHLGVAPVFGTEHSLSGLAKKYSGLPIIANGKLQNPEAAEGAIASGEGDFISVAKGALADPAWARKIETGEAPIPFDPAMITPFATLDCYAQWREDHAAGRTSGAKPRDKAEAV